MTGSKLDDEYKRGVFLVQHQENFQVSYVLRATKPVSRPTSNIALRTNTGAKDFLRQSHLKCT